MSISETKGYPHNLGLSAQPNFMRCPFIKYARTDEIKLPRPARTYFLTLRRLEKAYGILTASPRAFVIN